MNTPLNPRNARVGGRWVITGLVLSLASAAAMVFSGIGYRLDLFHFRVGFTILRWAFWFALAGGLLSLAGLIRTRGRPGSMLVAAIIGLAAGMTAAYIPWSLKRTAESLPYIHDISTDTANPPEFVAAAKLRKPGDHPVTYDGKEVADLQHQAYPDIAAFTSSASSEKAFEAAKAAIASMGMQLVDADPAQGRIEATQTSLLYGFTDDMVVRISKAAEGTKVDVRSKSRVGRSDLGQNAKRIRTFVQKMKTSLAS
ncbi:MAG TPA: DUF1499 domain-containing protein [Burkholderiales bacterium]|nr:DUF1499 domain-containing protein [Burkholderiales bacterium]